jgi:tripartite-type tricarboxylate transporter receptor subunit TctC
MPGRTIHASLETYMRIMNTPRLALAALLLTAVSGAAAQNTYPNKPIRLIATYSPGSSVDILARIVAVPLSEQLKQQIIVENKPGAGGDLATGYVANAPKDGYVLGIASPAPLTVDPVVRKDIPYDPIKDLAPISLIAKGPNILLVNAGIPAHNLAELIAYIKANPGKVSYASAGFGTSNHVAGELFRRLTHTDILHVPYKGNSEAITDVVAGRVQMLFSGLPPVLPFLQSGQLRAIVVADTRRTPLLPDLPTVAEAGLPGAESGAWYGLMAPAGTPPAVLDRLNTELRRVLQRPEIRAQLLKLGVDPAPQTRAEFSDMIKTEIAKAKTLFQGVTSTTQ